MAMLILTTVHFVDHVKAQNDYYFIYSINSDFSGNATLKQNSISTTIPFKANSTAELRVTISSYNKTCNNLLLNLTGNTMIQYSLLVPQKTTIPLKFSNSTVVCSMKDLWVRLLNQTFTTTTPILNSTSRLTYNYTLRFIGVEDVSNITSIHLKSVFNSTGLVNYNNTIDSYGLNSTADVYLSLIDNFLIRMRAESFFKVDSINQNTILFGRGYVELALKSTDYSNLYYTGPINTSSFKTNLGVDFSIITNSNIKSINVSGNKMTLITTGNGTAYLTVIYGKPRLGISIGNVNLTIDDKNANYTTIYMFDYAILSTSYTQSERRIDIDLGANVGVYNFTQTSQSQTTSQQVNWSYIIYPVIIAVVFALIIVALLWRRTTFKSS